MIDNRVVLTDFAGTADLGRLQRVDTNFPGIKPEAKAVLDKVRDMLVAGFTDMYGDRDQRKYVYIVQLIVEQVKALLEETNVASDVKQIKESLANAIGGKIGKDAANGIDAKKILSVLEPYLEGKKAKFDDLMSKAGELFKTQARKGAEIAAKDAEAGKSGQKKQSSQAKASGHADKKQNAADLFSPINELNAKLKFVHTGTQKLIQATVNTTRQLGDRISKCQVNICKSVSALSASSADQTHFQLLRHRLMSKIEENFKRTNKNITSSVSKVKKIMDNSVQAITDAVSVSVGMAIAPLQLAFKALSWGVGKAVGFFKKLFQFFMTPEGLVTLAAISAVVWKVFRKPIVAFYEKHVQPVISAVGRMWEKWQVIWGGDNMLFGEKLKESWNVVWNAMFPNGLYAFLAESIWPILRDNAWPFIKKHWKEILVGMGLSYLVTNPFGAIAGTLSLVKSALGIGVNLASATGGVGLKLLGGMGHGLVAMGPFGIAALAAVSISAYIVKGWIDELGDALKEQDNAVQSIEKRIIYDANAKHAELVKLQSDLSGVIGKWTQVFDKLGLDDPGKKVTRVKGADGKAIDVEFLQETMQKQAQAAFKRGNMDKIFEKYGGIGKNVNGDKKWWQLGIGDEKPGMFTTAVASIQLLLQGASDFATAFASDKLNYYKDGGITARHKNFMKALSDIQSATVLGLRQFQSIMDKENELQVNSMGQYVPASKMPDDQFNEQLTSYVESVTRDVKTAMKDFIVDKNAKVSEAFVKSRMNIVDSAIYAIRDRTDIVTKNTDIDARSGQFESALADADYVYKNAVSAPRMRQVEILNEHMMKMFDKYGFAVNQTKEDRAVREQMQRLFSSVALAKNIEDAKALTEEQRFEMLKEAQRRIAALPEGDLMKKYMTQLDAVVKGAITKSMSDTWGPRLDQADKQNKAQREETAAAAMAGASFGSWGDFSGTRSASWYDGYQRRSASNDLGAGRVM